MERNCPLLERETPRRNGDQGCRVVLPRVSGDFLLWEEDRRGLGEGDRDDVLVAYLRFTFGTIG